MHAFLSPNKPVLSSAIDTLEIVPETSVGIEEVRQIQHFLSRKPIQSDHNLVIIHQAHLLTIPAQNALLKTLEEPPGQSQIYLVTDFPDQLLPTVLSRVQIINQKTEIKIDGKKLKKTRELLDKLLQAKVRERLKLMDEQNFTRETALEFLNCLEYLIHQDLSLAKHYAQVVETRKYLKANCNIKLSLDNLLLGL